MTGTMRALVHYALEEEAVELRELPIPSPGRQDVLIRVRAVGICGSDVHQYHNTQAWNVRAPVILGHEFCGTVEEIGDDVTGLAVGELVASETAARIDPDSPMTRSGTYHLDPARLGFGSRIDGAMAEYIAVPARLLHRVPGNVPAEIAAMTEPCCVAFQTTVVNARVRPGDLVVIIGPGPIGLLCALFAHMSGAADVVVAGTARSSVRFRVADMVGASHSVLTENLVPLIGQLGDGYGADVVIDAAGVSESLKAALDVVRPGGQVTKVGWGPRPLDFSLDLLVQKAVTLQGSYSHTWPVWDRVLRMLGTGQLDPSPLLSRVSGLDDWKASFDGMHSGQLVKAVLLP